MTYPEDAPDTFTVLVKIITWGRKYGPRGAYSGCTGVLTARLTPEQLYGWWDAPYTLEESYRKIEALNAVEERALAWVRQQYEEECGLIRPPDPVTC